MVSEDGAPLETEPRPKVEVLEALIPVLKASGGPWLEEQEHFLPFSMAGAPTILPESPELIIGTIIRHTHNQTIIRQYPGLSISKSRDSGGRKDPGIRGRKDLNWPSGIREAV